MPFQALALAVCASAATEQDTTFAIRFKQDARPSANAFEDSCLQKSYKSNYRS
ncbi:hypothetical protein APV28_0596 [Comamonas testosteroni]|nr:hypothetical protein APV28_0596 [Comamonas testosteroni]